MILVKRGKANPLFTEKEMKVSFEWFSTIHGEARHVQARSENRVGYVMFIKYKKSQFQAESAKERHGSSPASADAAKT